MKKLSIFFLTFVLIFLACKKSNEPTDPYIGYNKNDIQFINDLLKLNNCFASQPFRQNAEI